MLKCHLCERVLSGNYDAELEVPSGTQLFSDSASKSKSLLGKISITNCSSCGLIQLTNDALLYEEVSSSASFSSEDLTAHRLEQLKKLTSFGSLPAKGSLLEVGCGDGHLMKFSESMFSKNVGIEPTTHNAKAAQNDGLEVYQEFMDADTTVKGAPFDYFCSFHVMEHVKDLKGFLQGISSNLSDGAVGIIEVPATEAALENSRFGDFMPDHLNYFTEATMRLAIEINGFDIIEIYRDWNNEHLVAYVSKRESRKILDFIPRRQSSINSLVDALNDSNEKIVIWGASHHSMPYMPRLSKINNLIIVDGASSKCGRYVPGTDQKVSPPSVLSEHEMILVAITAPRFKPQILAELNAIYSSLVVHQTYSELLGFEVFTCSRL
jgi:SAM-dependent methyltransferase